MNRRDRTRLGIKLTAWYSGLVIFLVLLLSWMPEAARFLPIGGLDELNRGDTLVTETDVLALVTSIRMPLDLAADTISVTLSMLGALALMIPLRWLYLAVGDLEVAEDQPANHKVSASLLLLPLVVTAIIVIVKFSLALAFALAGIFAGVRYRTTLKNLTDALFIFACMAIGLAAGTQTLGIAFTLSVFFAFTALMLEPLMEDQPEKPSAESESPDSS